MAEKKQPAKKAEPAKPAKKPAEKAAPKAETKKPAAKTEPDDDQVVEIKSPAGPVKVSGFALKQRQRLLDLRDELVDAMSGMTGEIRNAPEGSEASGSGMHQGDAGSDAYDRDFALSVLAKEQDALYEIEQALRRIDRGVYGVCEMSGKSIPQARLEAIPFARLTVECQAQWEKEYGNRRFRPSNEVGFAGGNYSDDEDSETVSLDEDDD
jgi:DnaK suppressor protein